MGYRCARYNAGDHPRIRVTEAELDRQMLALFDKMRIQDDSVRDWFRTVLNSQTYDAQRESQAQRHELTRQETALLQQQDRLLNLRIADQIDQDAFAAKQTELRDRMARIRLQLDVLDRSHDETAEIALKAYELSQTLREKWLTADYSAKRRILEIVCLNCRLDGASVCPTIRKPFDVLAGGLENKDNRGDSPCAMLDEIAGWRLVRRLFPQSVAFQGDTVDRLVKPGLYRKRKLTAPHQEES